MNSEHYKPDCWCDDVQSKLSCESCGVYRNTLNDEKWQFTIPGASYYYKCRHSNFGLKLSDTVTVYASSHVDRDNLDQRPDWGLYLDSMWKPNSMAGFIEWKDFGLPVNWEIAAHMIIDAYEKAESGYWVEVSCIGGHGRTGTVLAAMAVLSGMTADEAIEFVRKTYCYKAIETDEQEWWISWFDAYVNSGKTKPNPDAENAGEVIEFTKPFDWRVRNLLGVPNRTPSEDNEETVNYRYLNEPERPKSVLTTKVNYIKNNSYLMNILEDLDDEICELKKDGLTADLDALNEWVGSRIAEGIIRPSGK